MSWKEETKISHLARNNTEKWHLRRIINKTKAIRNGNERLSSRSTDNGNISRAEKFNYPVFGLCEEAGKFKKIIRDSNPKRDANGVLVFTPEQTRAVALELGDVIWYVAVLAPEMKLLERGK